VPRNVADDPRVVEVRLVSRPGRGIAPLPVAFEVDWYRPGSDRILRIDWDFDGDGIGDASGFSAAHVFPDPGSHPVTATITTRDHGTFQRTAAVRVHSAMMTLTLDDGHVTQHDFALPTFQQRGILPTAYIVPEWVEWRETGVDLSYMSWAEVETLQQAGWDIGSHSLTHPHLPLLAEPELRVELEASRDTLRAHGFPAKHFALPFGEYDSSMIPIVMEYYESNRATGNSVNPSPTVADPSLLKVKGTNWFKTLEEYQGYLDEAIAAGGWLILNNHVVRANCQQISFCVQQQMLDDILDYAEAMDVGFGTIDDVVSGRWAEDPTVFERPAAGHSTGAPGAASPAPRRLALRVAGPAAGGAADVALDVAAAGAYRVTVHDVRGRTVAVVLDGVLANGEHRLRWSLGDADGHPVGAGVYFLRARGAGSAATAKVVVVRR